MPDRRVTFAVWQDAKTNPPLRGELVRTDLGPAWLMHDGAWSGEDHFTVEPSVWCDPTPPGDDALTLEDLDDLYDFLRGVDSPPTIDGKLRRLRRALDQIEATP